MNNYGGRYDDDDYDDNKNNHNKQQICVTYSQSPEIKCSN